MTGCSACSWGKQLCFPPNCMHHDGPQPHAVRAPSARPADDATGFERAPDRYTAGGTERETIDEMRDLAWNVAERLWLSEVGDVATLAIADALFAFHCDATALKYERRKGRKGAADEDAAKARWYRAMAAHARGEGPDPRVGRPDFKPYQRPETT